MAFDQATRNRLARFVSEARNLLTEEFTRQLQHEYGLDPTSGTVTPLEKLTALDDTRWETASILRETMAYYLEGKTGTAQEREAVLVRILREQAFTVLNRICALRLAEARGLILQAVGGGYQSQGFQLYARLVGPALGETGEAYRSYLFSLFDEMAVELPPLFDRFSPEGRLFPRQTALLALLDLLNDPELESLWVEDETIGWIYQYFNTQEERRAMRAASSAPRNSRELAVRNQFFTPRYVVEFLTDNTLGRIWYEMTKGDTSLAHPPVDGGTGGGCAYLVRRPTEIFLNEGAEAPEQESSDEELSQEELLRQPVYVPYRQLKDPREIKMLDPACGSMHFGLYAFDLFEQIYAEAWDLEGRLGAEALWRLADLEPLHETYPDKAAFSQDVPRLIIEYNIHGIDIDPRAVQIAGLSLWLRAHKSWEDTGVRQAERPQIRKSNIVCAEPMPGDRRMLDDFLATLDEAHLEALLRETVFLPAGRSLRVTKAMADALVDLVRVVWEAMELAGEAGSLLKIEETMRDAIEKGRKVSAEKSPLFRVLEYDLGGNPSYEGLDFWDYAERLVLAALQTYAEQVRNGIGYRRRLFTEDAVQGFSFIYLARKCFDVILMNPPFGSYPSSINGLVSNHYIEAKNDLAAIFIQKSLANLNINGFIGVLSTRNLLVLGGYQDWRKAFLLESGNLRLLADLGYGVLDDAMVEVAAYTIAGKAHDIQYPSCLISCLSYEEKAESLYKIIKNQFESLDKQYVSPQSLLKVPGSTVASNISAALINKIVKWDSLESQKVSAKVGVSSGTDERFLRLAWEPNPSFVGQNNTWVHLAKGGEWYPFWGDIFLLIRWKDNGKQVKAAGGTIRNPDFYFLAGLTYPERTTSSFGPRILPEGCIFTTAGQAIFFENQETTLAYLGLFLCRPGQLMVELSLGSGDTSVPGTAARHYLNGMINRLLFPHLSEESIKDLSKLSRRLVQKKQVDLCIDETSRYFISPLSVLDKSSLRASLEEAYVNQLISLVNLSKDVMELEILVSTCFGFDQADGPDLLCKYIGPLVSEYRKELVDKEKINSLFQLSEAELVSLARNIPGMGKRYITKNSQLINRKLELISHITEISILTLLEHYISTRAVPEDFFLESTKNLVSYILGACFGRWNICFAIGDYKHPKLPDVFTHLPACPPGMLQNKQGLSAAPSDIPNTYPLRISWLGILIDDPGHPEDIVNRLRDALQVAWDERAEAIETEACEILGVGSLREYFQRSNLFFDDHLKRYSKSRRYAPIYWPLSTPSGSYTLWLYYHRINDQILYTCITDFVDPKLKQVGEDLVRLRQKSGRSRDEESELERLSDLERELKDFRDELLRVAAFWKPNLNDGVQITAAPLWRLFQHRNWQKRLKSTWEKLEAGDYDWAHLAYSIWPERVREKCKKDKSLAIAHDLEHMYVEPVKKKKKSRRKKKSSASQSEMFNED